MIICLISGSDVNQSDTSDSGGDGNWFRYNAYVSTVLCVAYGLVFCIGLVGNSLVPFAVLRTNNQRRCVTNIFFVNLAIADLLVILACVPFTLVAHLINRKSLFDSIQISRFHLLPHDTESPTPARLSPPSPPSSLS